MKPARGIKRSSLFIFRRRLLVVRLLMRQPMPAGELITAVKRELGEDGYPDAGDSAFKHDRDALKDEFGCIVRYDRSTRAYVLADLGDLAVLDLPDGCMEALAALERTFPAGAALPEHAGIRQLLERVLQVLPEARREQHRRQRAAITLKLFGTSPGTINPDVFAKIRRAIDQQREVEFDYLSLAGDGFQRRHRVAPYEIYFRPEGHGYLDATLLEVKPGRPETAHSAIAYRLDRIRAGSVRVLPTMLPKDRIPRPSYRLRYRLGPEIARLQDVASYFNESTIEYHDDGSATVTARVYNLWQTRRQLLMYGAGCVVLEPPELIAMFKEATRGLATFYLSDSA